MSIIQKCCVLCFLVLICFLPSLDSCFRLKIFVPIALLAWAVLVPVNWTNDALKIRDITKNGTSSDIDKLSISNVPDGSHRYDFCFFLLLNLAILCEISINWIPLMSKSLLLLIM